ncbi:HAD family hydrolase [Sphaerochaeta sp.]|uniref:HAD family hydrolase n=1 Tax=Sphaerochaeta sp. TaxID=1972642 RepID=UPI002A35A4DC|nr:HAD family hydrolase [Sphaerochaeta sp.]MDX9985143.1 HAD family hydrolase [Sphaerochaeta sp.]
MSIEPKIRLVVSDLDGTLLDEEGRLPPFLLPVVQSLDQKGIGFTFISGRPLPFLRGIIDELKLTMPFGTANGGMIYRGTSILKESLFPMGALRGLMETACSNGATVLYYLEDIPYTMSVTPWILRQRGTIREYKLAKPTEKQWAEGQLEKISMIFDDVGEIYRIVSPLLDVLEEEYTIVRYNTRSCEIMAQDVSKGRALIMLSEILGIPLSQIMAIGDDENDIDMLEKAGLGVAVGNAVESAMNAADYVCKAHNTEGVIEAINRFIP